MKFIKNKGDETIINATKKEQTAPFLFFTLKNA